MVLEYFGVRWTLGGEVRVIWVMGVLSPYLSKMNFTGSWRLEVWGATGSSIFSDTYKRTFLFFRTTDR